MDVGTLVVLFFHICVIYASAVRQAENGLAPQKLDDRDISTICGFFYDSVTTSNLLTRVCDDGLPCEIDRYVTPNIIFCAQAGYRDHETKYYSYGGWPQGGCGISEACCPSVSPNVVTAIYDNGATYDYDCKPNPYTFSVFTQLGDHSIYLTPYTTIDIATSTSTMAANQGVTLMPSSTSTTASPQSVVSATSSMTASSVLISSTSSTTVTSAASSTTASSGGTTVPQASSPDNTKLKIDLAAGLSAGIIVLISIVIFLMRRLNQARTHPNTQEHAESRWTESVTMVSAELDGSGDSYGGPT
ncbi:hypothetical protein V8E54_001995 [Elaphomyces granulatus]